MKKICIIAYDTSFALGKASGAINGGTAWLWHIMHTFQSMGHEAFMIDNGSFIPEADVIIIQSEWYATQGNIERFEALRKQGTKLVVILGHFIGGVYFNPDQIEADLFVSTWKGPVVDNFRRQVKFWPHAYCNVCDKEGSVRKGDIVFIGNNYPLRKEHWLEGLNVERVQGVMPDEVGQIYRGAKVCPNFHGDFQKGVVSEEPSRLATEPGYACNERLFQIAGAGGFQVADNNPQIREFYSEEEVPCGENKEDFQNKIKYFLEHPEEREAYILRAKAKTPTYKERCAELLSWLNL